MVSATDTNTMGDANQHENLDHGETSFFSKVCKRLSEQMQLACTIAVALFAMHQGNNQYQTTGKRLCAYSCDKSSLGRNTDYVVLISHKSC